MKLIAFFLLITILICSVQSSSNADGWIEIPGRTPAELREEIINSARSDNGRIHFGNRAVEGQFPFMGSLLVFVRGQWFFGCGSTLISPTFVLSAAHCFTVDFWRDFTAIGVDFGSVDRHRMPTMRDAISYLHHPLWEAPGTFWLEHDITILRLDSPVSQTPAGLPPRWTRDVSYEGVALVTAGWGEMENGQQS